jgi:hypothetical protein
MVGFDKKMKSPKTDVLTFFIKVQARSVEVPFFFRRRSVAVALAP